MRTFAKIKQWKPNRLLVCAVAATAIGAGSVGAFQLTSGEDTFTFKGTITLTDTYARSGEPCMGIEGYDDIGPGTAATILNAEGQVVGATTLTAGTGTKEGFCKFTVEVPDVPKGSKFYQFKASHRHGLTVTSKDAQSGTVSAYLG